MALLAVVVASGACASLEGLRQLVQVPRFEQVRDQPAEVRIEGPSATRALGGATIRIHTAVTNPNPFGLTLGTLDGTLSLEGDRAAAAAFPLGLPLEAGERSIVPLDLIIDFADLPALVDVVRRAARREPVGFRLDGTIGVDAGRLGQPVFGPMTLMQGELRTVREPAAGAAPSGPGGRSWPAAPSRPR
jgi:hypothetical protein